MKKTILITGASSGIGKATANLFNKKGWNVSATMRNPDTVNDLNETSSLKKIKLDVQNKESIIRAVELTQQSFGQIHVVLNNAGYGAVGPFEAATDLQIKRQFEVNLFGLMDVTKAVIPHFKKNNYGLFINVTSLGGLMTFPIFSIYHASKFAVEGFTEALQYELNPFGIEFKLIEPGAVATDFATRSLEMFNTEEYPDYDIILQKTQDFFSNSKVSSSPEQVAEIIFNAATDDSKQLRYIVGEDAKQIAEYRAKLPYEDFRNMIKGQVLGTNFEI
ncbi:SDR family oxidoreductase [Labilibaculum euxinus]|uniref:SDR family NAD(P)-dependent oxidoreductase n=1 Tax=Labilibaculum euxinus TaxID=2686357 RepID=A0A7M4DAM5_9BACT|nr:SDR family oxidoreductase [Labilibaculum euxinus]MUP39704.1 SDR family NAD(P)-dependent oxidoreductase [Labilibaculum euxinus]MVB08909.1 SDR family NAD(P)-dependent oxidoreductase [Labilibaculum euxinus]